MALTGLTNLQPLHIKTVGIGTFDNAVSIGGTLTYEDVTNVDAIGIITARSGINVSGGQLDVGSNIKLGNAGVITATSFVGSGSGLTGLNSDLVNDTSPQLGGNLDTNSYEIMLDDDHKVNFGDSNDLEIWHSPNNNSYIKNSTGELKLASDNLALLTTDQSKKHIQCNNNGAVELYHNDSKTFETTNEGVTFDTGSSSCVVRLTSNTDAVSVLQGFNSDLYIKAPSGGNLILYANGNEDAIKCIPNGAVELYDNGSKQCQTFDGGMNWQDNKKAEFGASGDLKLYHNGTDSYISNGTNNLRIGNTHNNNIKFFTQGNTRWNINGDGHIIPDSNNTFDIGASSYRVRNIYTADLHCSNKGSSNDVDGTWGDYTIQEGESDLFLINNRSGKKYKFNLTEVS